MKTERELFEDWLKKEYPVMYQWYSDGLDEWETKVEYMFVAWQARVPEGYVVVPIEPSEDMIMAGCMEHGGYDVIDSKSIYKAMIEALEK